MHIVVGNKFLEIDLRKIEPWNCTTTFCAVHKHSSCVLTKPTQPWVLPSVFVHRKFTNRFSSEKEVTCDAE